jgi:transcription initiation factor TFIIIB Brf1 subunit/transcription initiation factor TFIIB
MGNIVCQRCGLVQKSRLIDETAEWRNFGVNEKGEGGNGGDKSRVGGELNPFQSDFGLQTSIRGQNDFKYSKMLEKTNFISMTSKDKSLQTNFEYIREVVETLSIAEVVQNKAYSMAKQVEDSGLGKGVKRATKCTMLLFMAGKEFPSHAVPLNDLIKVTEADRKAL